MDTSDHYRRVADGFEGLLPGISDWQATTPCEDWDVTALCHHVVDVHHMLLDRLESAVPPPPEGDDVPARWRHARAAVEQALADRGEQPVESFGSTAPFRELVDTVLCTDVLLHSWDLARGTGQDDTLDLSAVAEAQAFLTLHADMLRRPGGFGPEQAVPLDASPQDRLVAFAGRQP